MGNTYCGKSCEACIYMQEGKCPGCNEGPGNKEYGACDLARCCHSKALDKCEDCKFNEDCYLLNDKEIMPERMAKKAREEMHKREGIGAYAPILASWITTLLILSIPAIFAGVFLGIGFTTGSLGTALVGSVITLTTQGIYAYGLFKISIAEPKYKIAAVFVLLSAIFTEVLNYIPLGYTKAIAVISVIGTLVGAIGVYYESYSHSKVVKPIDYKMSKMWDRIWSLQLVVLVVFMINLLLSVMSGEVIIVTISTVVSSVVILILSFVLTVMKLLALHGTSNAFKFYNFKMNEQIKQSKTENIPFE